MHIVLVHVHVKPESLAEFTDAIQDNARNSIQEPGIARFDILESNDDPTRFILVEVYRTPDDAKKHKETTHYQRWRERVEDMMTEPRLGVPYKNIFPADDGW
jgi:(4S)-4-hydroxy-5-phosphonooxypentane-2,3-dione isomerase